MFIKLINSKFKNAIEKCFQQNIIPSGIIDLTNVNIIDRKSITYEKT